MTILTTHSMTAEELKSEGGRLGGLSALSFEVPGTPVAKARARFSSRNGCAYTPSATAAYERSVQQWAQLAMLQAGRKTTTAPVSVEIHLYFPIPESWSKSKKERAIFGQTYPKSVDVDNVAKSLLDGCNGIVFDDDSQVIELHVTKRYGLEPKARVFVTEVP